MDAPSNSLPPFAAIQSYLIFKSLFNMILNWNWKGIKIFRGMFRQAIKTASTVAVGFSVIYCNEADFYGISFGYRQTCLVACGWMVIDCFLGWIYKEDDPEFPHHGMTF